MVLFASLSALLAIAAFGGVLWPLWRQSRGLVLACVMLLSLSGFALYRVVGTPAALQASSQTMPDPRSLDEAIAQLREALQRHPNQLEGWLLLGRSLTSQQKFAEARDAFATALTLAPDQPEALVAAAQSRMLASPGQRLDATAIGQLERALALQPGNQRARWFLGVAQRQAGRPAQAARIWQPLLSAVDDSTRASLLQQINLARGEAGEAPLAPTIASRTALTVKLALTPELATRLRQQRPASVFVIARIPGGSSMPVAVQKHAAQQLPLTLTLTDSDSPMPTQKLSALNEVEVIARLSAGGSATRQPGDVETAPVRVKLPAATPVELVLTAH